MANNVGRDVILYKVSDPSDDPVSPKQGTLRYGATMITGKVWITFERNKNIKLEKPLLISSYTAIDGRGVDVGIEGFGCLLVYKATDVTIHGLRIHHCKAQGPSTVMGPDGKQMQLGQMDGDAIRLVTWRNGIYEKSKPWNFYSAGDLFTNGASFFQSGRRGMARPNYTKEQSFKVGDAKSVKALTSSAGALKCSRTLRC
ncbi:hypothetical protein H0E87_009972 [Populus deltoides]|uniref:Uncharacterized protein n=1 Tax=Populus deltoides TaxID=3696 RepID=A0A8T2YQY2_POPDE|nr:hypothetical protein H0E87_009972 [Populus deltoides]